MQRTGTPELESAIVPGKKYDHAMDRLLVVFDAIQTWPDNIAFLSKLLKLLQAHSEIPVIPRALTVSSSLALCLVPSLPSGVHQKSLQVYSCIFDIIGPEGLCRDLSIWLPGLLPLLSYAGIAVKSDFVNLFSTYILPLGISLRICSKALILALLPGMEDAQDEIFEASLSLLDALRSAINEEALFWSSLWLAIISTTSSSRGAALPYIAARMTKVSPSHGDIVSKSESSPLFAPDPGLLVRAFAAGLTDESSLVQRGYLEVLVSHLPVSSHEVRSLPEIERQALFMSAVQIVLRKDVGLNRRLWLWLTGNAVSPFNLYVLESLTAALRKHIVEKPVTAFRILLSLLDNAEIGNRINAMLFADVIRASFKLQGSDDFTGAIVPAKSLFEATDTGSILTYMITLVGQKEYDLLSFMLNTFNFDVDEFTTRHLPCFLVALLAAQRPQLLAQKFITNVRNLIKHISLQNLESLPNIIQEYGPQGAISASENSIKEQVGSLWLTTTLDLLNVATIENSASAVYEMLQYRIGLQELDAQNTEAVLDKINELINQHPAGTIPFEHLEGCIRTICILSSSYVQNYRHIRALGARLCENCWLYLGANRLRQELSSVQLLSGLARVLPAQDMESFLCVHVARDLTTDMPIQRFAALWTHFDEDNVVPLLKPSVLLVLDALAFSSRNTQSFLVRWIRSSLSTASMLVNVLLEAIAHDLPHKSKIVNTYDLDCPIRTIDDLGTLSALNYHCELFRKFLSHTGPTYIAHLASLYCEDPVLELKSFYDAETQTIDLISLCERVLSATIECHTDQSNPQLRTEIQELCQHSSAALGLLSPRSESCMRLLNAMLHKLALAIDSGSLDFQQIIISTMLSSQRQLSASLELEMALFYEKSLPILRLGIEKVRGHPVLQDWLELLKSPISSKLLRQNDIMQLSECIIENINLNLIDIDAVLTAKQETPLYTTHENILLMLNSLQDLAEAALYPFDLGKRASFEEKASPGASLFGGAFAFTTVQSETTETTGSVDPANDAAWQEILTAIIDVWVWAENLHDSPLPSARYVSVLFSEHAYHMIETAYKQFPLAVMRLLVNEWGQALPKRAGLQTLSDKLDVLGEERILALACKIVKSSLSFTPGGNRGPNRLRNHHYLSFLLSAAQRMSSDKCSECFQDIVGLLRHITLHLPMSKDLDMLAMHIASELSSRVMGTAIGQAKRNRRELTEVVTKLFGAVLAQYNLASDRHILDRSTVDILVNFIIPELPRVFLDLDKVANTSSMIMSSLISPRLNEKQVTIEVLDVLEAVSELESVRKTWRKEVQEYFASPDFFKSSIATVPKWQAILRRVLEDKNKLSDYTARPAAGAANIFTSHESEKLWKVAQNSRLVFLLMTMERDFYLAGLPAIEDKIQELAQGRLSSKSNLMRESQLLMRALLLKFDHMHLKDFWPVIIGSLERCFAHVEEIDDSDSSVPLLVSSLQTLDLLLYLNPLEFQPYVQIIPD